MAVLKKADLMTKLKALIGDKTDDDSLSFLEDFTDTFNDIEGKASTGDKDDWKQKYKELDKTWRQKYTDRFFNGEGDEGDNTDTTNTNNTSAEDTETEVPNDFNDLFVKKGE